MPDVLSQKEIDQLLSEIVSGEITPEDVAREEQQEIKTYNFRHPKKLARDQLRTLEMIHENYARYVSTSLSAQLRTYVEMKVASVEPLSYEEFTRSIMVPSVLGVGELAPLKGKFILEINPKVAFAIIDRLFGGMGGTPVENRTFTDIEGMALRQVMDWIFQELPEAWHNVIPELKPSLVDLESNPLYTQIIHHNDMIVLITFQVTINELEGFVNLCIPHLMLEPVVGRLTAQHWFSSMQEKKTEHKEKIENRLVRSYLPVSAELPKTTITLEDLVQLQEGDVLKLDVPVGKEVELKVGRLTKFTAVPGKKKDRLAVKIMASLGAGREKEDDE